jgi:hypothetical protein
MTTVKSLRRAAVLCVHVIGAAATGGCGRSHAQPATTTFYAREIGPILKETCANSPTQSGCHVAADDRGNAFGNLNVSSYETLTKRRDLFIKYGPYGVPALILKALPPFQVRLTTWESEDPIIVSTDIPHAGGSLLDITSTSYLELLRWIERGATENNALLAPPSLDRTPCSDVVGTDPAFDPNTDPSAPDYATFQSKVSPVLKQCAAGNCHGAPSNPLYLTCGDTPEQIRWNYFVAADYVSADPGSSEIVRRPLAPEAGGVYHEGGTLFQTTSDPGYQALFDWAKEKGGPATQSFDPGFLFFSRRVQPMLVRRGCMIIGCHSPAMGHDYRLRAGSGGHFGLPATRRNYELTFAQVALEATDPNASRLIRKNLAPFVADSPAPRAAYGILHRGGSLFGDGADCSNTTDIETGPLDAQTPYCVIRRWMEIEKEQRMTGAAPFSAIVYVKRPPSSAKEAPQDFEAFAPGADLVRAPASLDPASGALSVQAGQSLLGACGLSAANVDVRRPAVSWDGTRIAFSARTSAAEPWRIYVIEQNGSCAVEPGIDAAPVDDQGNPVPDNGELVHNFDPAFAPDGRIVFASTRGNVSNTGVFDYQGPQRTPADPSRLNANLYVLEDGGHVRQLTFLLNQELTPSFMSDGRLIMTTEKRANGFYQLAGRRENLDGGDYHPLFGQRATIGFHQVTDIVELTDKNFAAIFSDPGAAHGAGALGIVNRSLGPDQHSDDPADYLQDPGAKDWPNPEFFQHSVRFLDGNGKVGQAGGVYRNPAPLPNGKILVSYAANVQDITSFTSNFGLFVVDPITGERTGPVVNDTADLVWPVAVYARTPRTVFKSRIDEPNGATQIVTDGDAASRSDVTILSVPLLSSLMFQNTRSKRVIPPIGGSLEVWEDLPPEAGVTSYDQGGDFVVDDAFGKVYVRRRKLGSIDVQSDGSAHFAAPGGVPLVLAPLVQLAPADTKPVRHHQLEEMQFYPGEVVRQGFRQDLFNGVCASCHGATTGMDADISVNPDILTQASRVLGKDQSPLNLTASGAPQKPPFP